jgi:hypothetical protein
MKKVILILISGFTLFSCTENQRARSFGGSEEIKLRKNEILTNMTWKKTNLWIQTIDTISNISYFREKSSLGWVEGEIIVKQSK